MPVQIGQKSDHSFSEPIGLLTDCHRRLERFLTVLVRVAADVRGGAMTQEQRLAFMGALQYFRDAAPKHTADEELSLFPRLHACKNAEVDEVLAHIERLQAEHVRADRLHREVDDLAAAWLRNGTLPRDSAERLCSVTAKLDSIYKAHIETEDTLVFPLAARVLHEDAQRDIGREMAARRNIAVEAIR